MISVFQIFRIILGIIISAFILFIIITFAGTYTEIGESSRQVSVLVSFKKTMENVYTTGIADDFDTEDYEILDYVPPHVMTGVTNFVVEPVPLLLVPGQEFSITRNVYDTYWWKFYFVEVMPETKIMFIPLKNEERVWSAIGNITEMLPSTENVDTKVKFYLGCNKTDPSDFYPLGEKEKFLNLVPKFSAFGVEMAECDNPDYFRDEGYMVITVSDELVDADFLVRPMEGGTGQVYIGDEEDYSVYVYRNGLDIVALMLGGEELYDYFNAKFLRELGVATDLGIRESELLMGDPIMRARCRDEFHDFTSLLASMKELIGKLDYHDDGMAAQFNYYLREITEKYRALERSGCG